MANFPRLFDPDKDDKNHQDKKDSGKRDPKDPEGFYNWECPRCGLKSRISNKMDPPLICTKCGELTE